MNPTPQNNSGDAPVDVRGLKKSFGAQVVLAGIDLRVKEGETLAVLGRSGGGKSVLLKLLIGLQTPDAGTIRIFGEDIAGLSIDQLNEVRKKMGFLFQQAALYDSLTVRQNVEFPLSRHTKMSISERKARVEELLSIVGMPKDLEKMPSQISGGMQKRVGLARALALEPSLFLFDEPTAGLDPITASEIANLIATLRRKRKITSVVVTHDLHSAKVFSDRLVLMEGGKILADGSFQELQTNGNEFVNRFMKEAA